MIRPGSAPVREGDLLAGKYRVERVLGSGGMGIVVAARHIELDQLVAIKFVRDEALSNEQGVQRFLREARAAVKLKSEHVARVLDVGKLESGAPFMVMEYLEGSDLATVLAEQGPLPHASAADWIMQACEAVAEAHAAGIVHRDLKPENLFLTRAVGGAPKVKVLDFGVSKAVQGPSGDLLGLTRTRAMLGSPLYMSPEQMRSSRDVDSRSDIWAMGVVLFQLLTARWPFEADSMPELCLKVVSDPPLSLAALRPDVPQGMVGVVERCLSKDPAKRFAQAGELASALEPFAPPASRVFAERARLAIEGGAQRLARSDADALPGSTEVSTTSLSASGGERAGTNTPATSAAWGTERREGASAPEARRGRAAAMVIGVSAVGAAASVVLAFALRRPLTDGTPPSGPVSSSAAPDKSAPTPMAQHETIVALPAPALLSSGAREPAVPVAPASGASETTPSFREASAPPAKAALPPQPPRRVIPRAVPDEDIPTIR
jgi:eukaryotic-like serine/threonine-protein kinase